MLIFEWREKVEARNINDFPNPFGRTTNKYLSPLIAYMTVACCLGEGNWSKGLSKTFWRLFKSFLNDFEMSQ